MLTTDDATLVVVDLQVKLLPVMQDEYALMDNADRLIRGALALGLPIVWTEQNPDGLGPTAPQLADLLPGEPITKLSFSCCGEPAFSRALASAGRKQILLAGIETHVCVYQTCLDLLAVGYKVEVVSDAVSSRAAANKSVALARMSAAGAGVTSVEIALFELLKVAQGPAFKQVLKIVK